VNTSLAIVSSQHPAAPLDLTPIGMLICEC
jgi:hypothetical protein